MEQPLFKRESDVHKHCPQERADLFSAIDGGSAELEVLQFLEAMVFLFKPERLLETGTGPAYTSRAIVSGMAKNGFGQFTTLDIDELSARYLADRLDDIPMLGKHISVAFHQADSKQWIREYQGPPFDFVFFDSLIDFRHTEFELLMSRSKLVPWATCVFHDTSRLRGETMPDFNPEMISALDRFSHGRQWLESDLSRGLRVIRLGPRH